MPKIGFVKVVAGINMVGAGRETGRPYSSPFLPSPCAPTLRPSSWTRAGLRRSSSRIRGESRDIASFSHVEFPKAELAVNKELRVPILNTCRATPSTERFVHKHNRTSAHIHTDRVHKQSS